MRIIIFLLANLIGVASASDFESRYYSSVFSGDLSWVSDAKPKTQPGISLKSKFNEHFLLRIDNTAIVALRGNTATQDIDMSSFIKKPSGSSPDCPTVILVHRLTRWGKLRDT